MPATGNAEDGSALQLRLRQVQRALLPGEPTYPTMPSLNETEEDSAQNQEGNNPHREPHREPPEDTYGQPHGRYQGQPHGAPHKKDVVYEYAPADPEPEQQATKLAPTTSADPEKRP